MILKTQFARFSATSLVVVYKAQHLEQVANHLYCGAKVVGGHEHALKFLEANKTDFKIRRTKRLAVSGAFHTPLMAPALEVFGAAVSQTRWSCITAFLQPPFVLGSLTLEFLFTPTLLAR